MSAALLEIRDLRVRFRTADGAVPAVDGVTLRVDEGEAVALVGESGSGKTVTALSVLGLLPPQAEVGEDSEVLYRGDNLLACGPRRLREIRGDRIAMVFQEPMTALNPVLRVGDQVGEGLRVHRGAGRREARREAVRLLGEVRVPDPERVARAYPHELSGGMRQRALIAMALACGPELLIADEPTTALDVTIQAQILDLLLELRERHGMALLLITHDLAIVAETCDRIAVMYAGEVVEEAPAAALYRAPAHPYTRGLLASLPGGSPARGRLPVIPGAVPAPGLRPVGCRFRPRCAEATEGCDRPQDLRDLGGSRRARCHRSGVG